MARFGRVFPFPRRRRLYEYEEGPTLASGSLTLTASVTDSVPLTAAASITLSAVAVDLTGTGSITLGASATDAPHATATGSIVLTGTGINGPRSSPSGSVTLTAPSTVASFALIYPIHNPAPVGRITYFFYDLVTLDLITELPMQNVTFGQRLNAAGSFSGDLNLRDPKVQQLNPLVGTRPGRTMLCIDIDGTLEWCGIVWTRRYTSSTGLMTISGQEVWSYFNYRLQAKDYTAGILGSTYPGYSWWGGGASPMDVQFASAAIVADALTQVGNVWTNAGSYGVAAFNPSLVTAQLGTALSSLKILVATNIPSGDWSIASYPLSQRQTISQIITTLSSTGYGVGYDFGIDVAWSGLSGSTPEMQLTFSWPTRGRDVSVTGNVIDIGQDTDYEWDEDATSSLNNIFATASGAGASAGLTGGGSAVGTPIQANDSTPLVDGYPLMEGTQGYTQVNTQAELEACALGDLGQLEWPITTPGLTLPMFSPAGVQPSIGQFIMGDNIRIIMAADDRFPASFDTTMRVVAVDYTVPDQGAPTMKLTFNMPLTGGAPVAQAPL